MVSDFRFQRAEHRDQIEIRKVAAFQPNGSRIRKNSDGAQFHAKWPEFLQIRLQIVVCGLASRAIWLPGVRARDLLIAAPKSGRVVELPWQSEAAEVGFSAVKSPLAVFFLLD